jgi:hypothetical protein
MISTFFGGAALGRAAGCACKRDSRGDGWEYIKNGNSIGISWGFSGKHAYSKTKKTWEYHGNWGYDLGMKNMGI